MILEGIGTSDVADDSSGVPVPALIHDAHEISARVKYAIVEAIPSVVKVLVHMEPYRDAESNAIFNLPPA